MRKIIGYVSALVLCIMFGSAIASSGRDFQIALLVICIFIAAGYGVLFAFAMEDPNKKDKKS